MTIEHRTTRVVTQPTDVVHARILELASQLRDQLPPIQADDQLAKLIGIEGAIGLEIRDLGPARIDVATLRGRIRVRGTAELEPTSSGETSLSLGVAIKPDGLIGRMMLGVATKAVPGFDRKFRAEAERAASELAEELGKPDNDWAAGRLVDRVRPVVRARSTTTPAA